MSPYEEHISRTGIHRIGLLAAVRPGSSDTLATLLAAAGPEFDTQLLAAGIRNFSVFLREIEGRTWCMAHFHFAGPREAAIAALEKASPLVRELSTHLEPHPRARGTWLRMEWITLVPGAPGQPGGPVEKFALVTGLKPEKEAEYRSLHQTNWPGVSDQLARSNIRDWTTFLIEIGEKLFLFSYYEYVGTDRSADDAALQADPVTQRWWKLTDACQEPLPDMAGKGIWSTLTPLRTPP